MSSINPAFGQSQDSHSSRASGTTPLETNTNYVSQSKGKSSENPMESNANVTRTTLNANLVGCQSVRSRPYVNQVPNNFQNIKKLLLNKWFSRFFSIFAIVCIISTITIIILWKKDQQSCGFECSFNDRSSWDAIDPGSGVIRLKVPVQRVILADTADETESCKTKDECIQRIKAMQSSYMKTLSDIPYNFLIGDDGNFYEGRGFEFQGEIVMQNNLTYTYESAIIVAFIGNFTSQQPSSQQLKTFLSFLFQFRGDKMVGNYTLVSQDQITGESSDKFEEVFGENENYHRMLNVTKRNVWDVSTDADFTKAMKFTTLINKILIDSMYTMTDDTIGDNTSCDFEVLENRLTLDRHPSVGFYDIRQNFFISKFGVIEGRGWSAQPQYNSTISENFLYIGIIKRSEPGEANQLNETLNRLVKDGILLGKIVENPEMNYHCSNCGFVERNAWHSHPLFPDRTKKLTTPVTRVIATYTTHQDESCTTIFDCIRRVHTSHYSHHGDIPYNFLVGDDGNVYEGRGFTWQGGTINEEIFEHYDHSLFVAFIGNFTFKQPNAGQVETFNNFLTKYVDDNEIMSNFKLISQNQLFDLHSNEFEKVLITNPNFIPRLKITNRSEWDNRTDIDFTKARKFETPINKIVIDSRNSLCVDDNFIIQTICEYDYFQSSLSYDIDEGLYDIRDNFFIRDSTAAEARGWNRTPDPAETVCGDCLSIQLIYGAKSQAESEKLMRVVFDQIVEYGKVIGKISSDYDAALDGHDWGLN